MLSGDELDEDDDSEDEDTGRGMAALRAHRAAAAAAEAEAAAAEGAESAVAEAESPPGSKRELRVASGVSMDRRRVFPCLGVSSGGRSRGGEASEVLWSRCIWRLLQKSSGVSSGYCFRRLGAWAR